MKLFFSAFFFFILGLAVQAQKVVSDPNVEVREVKSFTSISVSSAFDVILSQSTGSAVAVSASDKDEIQYIRTEVRGNVLNIWYDNKDVKKKSWSRDKRLRAYISVKDLEVLKASGATDINIEGQLSVGSLKMELSGASDVTGKIVASGDLKVEMSGASDVNITGSAKNVDIEASGASEFKAFDFTTGICRVEASGASGVSITVEKEISAELSGASSVNYKGSATVGSVKTSGASSVNRKS